ncbi:MAG: PhzF family phenazine biosynthesis protein [Sphingobacteriia bacterium]|nr:PhzF family phenazine biosynthesis protein [Sphingobacteriia bacterium]
MKQKIYQVDAFAEQLFSGNPAAVCPLDHWLEDDLLQKIAMENNLAETAYFVPAGDQFQLRWFTPTTEVDLCGHATLASAYVLFHQLGYGKKVINFHSPRSGALSVTKEDGFLTLDFPADTITEVSATPDLTNGLNILPGKVFKGKTDYMLVYEHEDQIKNIIPDFAAIHAIKARGIIVTARGKDVDFVSRFFAPQSGVNEDPVTGSAHTTLTPFWSRMLNKQVLTAKQLSARGGFLKCSHLGERVKISGQGRLYLEGEIFI